MIKTCNVKIHLGLHICFVITNTDAQCTDHYAHMMCTQKPDIGISSITYISYFHTTYVIFFRLVTKAHI